MSRKAARDEEFVAFVAESERDLRRTAYLLCGDWHCAEDAVQTALLKIYRSWHKADQLGSVWSYARRAVVNAVIDSSRRAWRRETVVDEIPDVSSTEDTSTVDDRMLLRLALASLPARQRAVVVLRYVEDLDVRETSLVLHCPEGTVTSMATRALTALRSFLVKNGVVRGATRNGL